MNLMGPVRVRHDCGTIANGVVENFTLDEELYRQIAAFAEKAWREVSVTQSFYDDSIRADLGQIKHD